MSFQAFSFTVALISALAIAQGAREVKEIVCVPITKCPTYMKILENKPVKLEVYQHIKSAGCGFDGLIQKVWCPNIGMKSPIEKEKPDTVPNRSLLPKDECGKQVADRIFGGTKTDLDEFPWLALIQYPDRSTGGLIGRCGGALITDRYVLTAAHCVTYGNKPVQVVLGEYDINNSTDCVDNECAPDPIIAGVEKIVVHPEWLVKERPFFHDIAIIRLNRTVKFNDFVRPICLPQQDRQIMADEPYQVAGWGQTETGVRSSIKLKVTLTSTTPKECKRLLKREVGPGQICAGGKTIEDTCKGDSGGPLMAIENGTAIWTAVGLVSLGTTYCGDGSMPAIYTFIPNYLNWILQNLLP